MTLSESAGRLDGVKSLDSLGGKMNTKRKDLGPAGPAIKQLRGADEHEPYIALGYTLSRFKRRGLTVEQLTDFYAKLDGFDK